MSFILTAYLKIKSPVGSFFAKLFIFLYNKGQYERGADLKELITGPEIKISGLMKRHKIVQKVVNTFIKTEHRKKGKGVSFRYPVERMPCGILYISRPGHKKNFDFKVEVFEKCGLGEGRHMEIAKDLRKKREENPKAFEQLFAAIQQIYDCVENDVGRILRKHPDLKRVFRRGAKVEVILKVLKWMFVMEDIVYWDNEGRAFLFNFFRYVANETDTDRLEKAIMEVKTPERLRSYMRKSGLDWVRSGG